MTDNFALLGEDRRPWLDLDSLKKRFMAQTLEVHPDHADGALEKQKREANDTLAELNTAYRCLVEPRRRLLHLLELEAGRRPKELETVPSEIASFCFEGGNLCRATDAFLEERSGMTSPLLKVSAFERTMEWKDRLEAFQRRIESRLRALSDELQVMNTDFLRAPAIGSAGRLGALPIDKLGQVYRMLSHLGRLADQFGERRVKLSIQDSD